MACEAETANELAARILKDFAIAVRDTLAIAYSAAVSDADVKIAAWETTVEDLVGCEQAPPP